MIPGVLQRWMLAALLLVGVSAPCAADLKAGLEAYSRQDYATAIREWTRLAEAGDGEAQFNLALMYAGGLGVTQDDTRAAELYREAADAGIARAQHALGQAYRSGRGVPADDSRAADWYRKAAVQELEEAQYELGVAYQLGVGVPQDPVEAASWYRRAARQGHVQSQLRLGLLLSDDPQAAVTDYEEATRWLELAVERGDAQAALRLGTILAGGFGVRQDFTRAISLLLPAAQNGIAEAQYQLGLIYENGRDFRRPHEARKWYATANRTGFRHARLRLNFDPRLRAQHLRRARILDWNGPGPVRIRDPGEIRRGPVAPVSLAPGDEVFCDFYPRKSRGGNPKFRCFLMTGNVAEGGRYYDASGNVQTAADAVLILDTNRGPRPVLAADDGAGRLEPLTCREGLGRRYVLPLEIKVKYRSLDSPELEFERDMYSEVAATRLLWALHYPADRMYRVRRIHCHRCPRDPFHDSEPTAAGRYTTFDEVAIELRYEADRVERYDTWVDGGWSWGEELYRLRYEPGPDEFSEAQKQHFDGLIVLMNIVGQVSPPPEQNRLLCERGNIIQLGGPFKFCPDTVLLVHDLGATFGKRQPDSLKAWRAERIWAKPETCETTLPPQTYDEHKVRHYRIGKAGQEFILRLLDQLTDEHLRALFESAGFERYDISLVPPDRIPSPGESRSVIDAWIAGLRDKVEQLRSVECEGS